MIAGHLWLILELKPDTGVFCQASQDLAKAQVPPDVLAHLRIRLTALQKPGGGVPSIMCGDTVRNVVARTTARLQLRKQLLHSSFLGDHVGRPLKREWWTIRVAFLCCSSISSPLNIIGQTIAASIT